MSGPPAHSPPPHGGQVIGRYALFGSIAAGGMATVHLGRLLGPVGFSRTVAIKRLHQEFSRDPEFVSMFLDEARLAARIRHPNVVPTLDVVATKGELFLVMEYVQGESLARLNRFMRDRAETIPPRIAVSIMSGALQGLHAAHEARDERGGSLGIVHRDVSPQNILVGIDGMSRVLDFGVAKATGRMQTTREGQIKGKLAYMPPEQLQAESLDRKADVYAASVVLWEVLTGERLFQGESEAVVLARVLSGAVRTPSEVRPSVPKSFDAVVMKGLARNPAERYETAKEMSIALEKCDVTASLQEVATWIETVAGATLHERATMIAKIEVDSGFNTVDALKLSVAEAMAKSDPPQSAPITSTKLGIGVPSSQAFPPTSSRQPTRLDRPSLPAEGETRASPSELSSASASANIPRVPQGGMPWGILAAAGVGAAAVAVIFGVMRANEAPPMPNPSHAPAGEARSSHVPEIPPIASAHVDLAPPSSASSTPSASASSASQAPPLASTPAIATTRSTSAPTSRPSAPASAKPRATSAPANPFDLGGRN